MIASRSPDEHARPSVGTPPADAIILNPEQAQAVVRLVEAAPGVRRRYQFFVWTQSQMQALLPHQLLVCGAYQRQLRTLALDAFHSVVLSPGLVGDLTNSGSPLHQALVSAWLDGQGRPRAVRLSALEGAASAIAWQLRQELGCSHLLVHGTSRPQRLSEVESLFILGAAGDIGDAEQAQRLDCLELMLPHLHSTWQRTAAIELELHGGPRPPPSHLVPRSARPAGAPQHSLMSITEREREILRWVREGLSNHEIAQELGISPLTVKNHVQKILRKLGAGNRAQAVAQALAKNLIDAAEPPNPQANRTGEPKP